MMIEYIILIVLALSTILFLFAAYHATKSILNDIETQEDLPGS